MLKKAEYRANGYMDIKSGLATFDKQCDLVTTGNIMSNCMYGTHVRAKTETECNGFTFPMGELQDSNLRPLRESSNPGFRRAAILASQHPFFETHSGWLYVICHARDKHSVIHGALLSDGADHLVARYDRHNLWLSNRSSSRKVLDTVMPYLIHTEG